MCKKNKFLWLVLLILGQAYSQNPGVEKNIFNFQAGLLGIWVNNETRLADEIVLRSEVGLSGGYFTSINDRNKYTAVPSFSIEPKWYYNIKGRAEKGRVTKNNSANSIGLEIKYFPDWFTISNIENYKVADQVSIIPKWGIRRSIGQSNFNYEIGAGIGYSYVFLKQYGYKKNDSEAVLDITVRIGYKF